jgi:hypothetical protein
VNVPKYIKDKIFQCAEHYHQAVCLLNDIEEWLINELGLEELDDSVADQIIDCLQQGTNQAKTFINFLENY